MVLHDNGAGRIERAAKHPRPRGKDQTVDVRDIRIEGGHRSRDAPFAKHVVDAASGDPGVPVKPLDDHG
jgi:hypothetical protein